MRLENKVALITGGSRGIGRAIALKLAEEGANIAIIYSRDSESAASTKIDAARFGVQVETYKCNVADYNSVKNVVSLVKNDFGDIDILVNNAGVIRDGLLINMSEDDYNAVLDINLKGAFNLIKSCYYGFIRKRSGKIINITSVTGINGNAGQANYACAKSGMIGLTKSVAKELGERNICCNAVAPGIIDTDMISEIRDNSPHSGLVPMKRIGKPEDVANAVAFLAGNESDYITGEVIRVDGGLAM